MKYLKRKISKMKNIFILLMEFHKKTEKFISYVATLFRFVAGFARIGILESGAGRSRE